MDYSTVNFIVNNPRRVDSRTVFALVDVDVEASGLSFIIRGVQARREPDGKTSIRLPNFRDTSGAWQPAITMPEETYRPLGAAVLEFLVEEGLARRVF